MPGVWTPDEIRAAEQRLFERVPEPAVMRRAAHGVAVHAARLLDSSTGGVSGRHVTLLVGAGNNGGDALWAGAFLRRRGVGVTAVLLSPEKAHAAGLAALRSAAGRVVTAEGTGSAAGAASAAALAAVDRADVVVDGIVGLSARGGLRAVAAELVGRASAPLVAVDLPSGVDPMTGAVDGPAVRAEVTVTFGGRKPCHVLNASHCGTVREVALGLELPEPAMQVLDDVEVGANWPVPHAEDDKYSQGVVGVAAGSATFPGAAVLASGAAVQATSGMVRYAGPAADAVRSHWPEVVATGSITDAGRVQSWAVGPGIGTGGSGREVLRHVLEAGRPICADADSITLLANDSALWDAREPGTPLVLTPHHGEFLRLAGDSGEDRVTAARRVAAAHDVVVLLKGNATVIAEPGGGVLVNPAGTAWPATAGSGDVLTGLIGSLLAAGIDPFLACGYAARAHALAGDLAAHATSTTPQAGAAGAPVGASALLAAVPSAIRELRARAPRPASRPS